MSGFGQSFNNSCLFEVSMPTFLFVANDPSLDLVNTEVVLSGVRTDLFETFRDLTQWFEQANLASPAEMQRLARLWTDTPEGRATLQAARALRSALRNAVERVARIGRVPSTLADVLGNELREPRLATEVVPSHGRLKTRPHWILEKPADLLVPVAHHAATFFAAADYSAIRKCENPECILFFYDTSKNHSRRWCSMELCGNRAKVAAFRERL
jgi:predicted RNA-binding Zn ribbon-like protein